MHILAYIGNAGLAEFQKFPVVGAGQDTGQNSHLKPLFSGEVDVSGIIVVVEENLGYDEPGTMIGFDFEILHILFHIPVINMSLGKAGYRDAEIVPIHFRYQVNEFVAEFETSLDLSE